MTRLLLTAVFVAMVALGGCSTMNRETDTVAEKEEISRVIHSSIGWAATKDKDLVFGCFARDPDLFWFSPRDDGTVHGFDSFAEITEGFFMLDDFQHVAFEIRELTIKLSESGSVAWFHSRLDDFNEWKGQPANWEDVRWTGVLEKRKGEWVIVQMHFSSAVDRQG